jgi:hypothetical protein
MKDLRALLETPPRTPADDIVNELARTGAALVQASNGERVTLEVAGSSGIIVAHNDSAALAAARAKRQRKAKRK